MTRLSLKPLPLLALLAAGPARAGEVACHFEGGVPVAPAQVAGIAGDYILDTGAARTQVDETRAQAEGLEGPDLIGDVRLAGVVMPSRALKTANLDVRTWNLPTPVAGVIGADVLTGYVVDISYAPCRVRLSQASTAPAFAGRVLPLSWDLDRPVAPAAVSDDAHRIEGLFVIATGQNVPVRLADDLAQAPGASKPDEFYPNGRWLGRLAGVSFAGAEGRDVAAGLTPVEGDVVGALGGQVLAHFRLRFDFPGGRLVVAPAAPLPPARAEGSEASPPL